METALDDRCGHAAYSGSLAPICCLACNTSTPSTLCRSVGMRLADTDVALPDALWPGFSRVAAIEVATARYGAE